MGIKDKWEDYVKEVSKCRKCTRNIQNSLIDANAFPLFMGRQPGCTDVLFVFEAPNKDDTYNPKKGFITIESDTDPSGALFNKLFTETLGRNISKAFVTNSVLCQPARDKYKKYPVTSKLRANCSQNLSLLIDTFNPRIICTLGVKALEALNMIEKHGIKNLRDGVAKQIKWNNRVLFPLYHTGLLARKPPYGRSESQQIDDWQLLKKVLRINQATQLPENTL